MAEKIINYHNLLYNVKYFKNLLPPNVKLCAVVKSNAYGHGVNDVVKVINQYVDYYAVTSAEEALFLRKKTDKPIIVLRKISKNNAKRIAKNNIEVAILNREHLRELEKTKQKLKVHLVFNSGMNRLGLSGVDFRSFYKEILKNKNLKVIGIFSHISDSDNEYRTKQQIQKFDYETKDINALRHIANTGCVLNGNGLFNMVRVGIGLYNLKPVMQIYANVIDIKSVKAGGYIGYGSKTIANKDMSIAIIDIGYADGLMRCYRGNVIIRDKLCRIVGNICMSMCFVNVTGKDCRIGDKVIVLGKSKTCEITPQYIAKKCHTIDYEILTNFNKL